MKFRSLGTMVNLKIPLQASFLNLLVISSLGSPSIDCPPAEEGHSSFLHIHISAGFNGSINLIKNREAMLQCIEIKRCEIFYDWKYNISVHSNAINAKSLIFTIKETLREGENPSNGIWSLIALSSEDIRIVKTCDLKVYAKTQNMKCFQQFSWEEVIVVCATEKIFPQATCSYKLLSREVALGISDGVTVQNEDYLLNELTYYRSKCFISIKYKILNLGMYTIFVNMYPDITGEKTDVLYGLYHILNFTIERPNIYLEGCPLLLEEGEIGKCNCKITNLLISGNSGSIAWYDKYDEQIENEGSGELKFTAHIAHSTFYCKAINILGFTSFPLQYIPTVLIKSQNTTCNIDLHQDLIVQIICYTLKVYPAAKCVFALKLKGVNIQYQGDILYNHTKLTLEPMHFQSQCTHGILKSYLTPGNYSVDITMYPDLNATEIVTSFGTNVSLHFFVSKPQNVTCSKKIASDGVNISCITGQVYPKVKCKFVITKSEINIFHSNEITYLHKPCKENPLFFTSVCSLYLRNSYLGGGDYRAINTMHPDEKDSLSTLSISVTTSLPFSIGVNEDHSHYIIISVIIGVLLIATATTIFVLLRRKKASGDMKNASTFSYKNRNQATVNLEEHVYETINDTSDDLCYQNVANSVGQQSTVSQKMLETEYVTVID